MPLGFTFTNEDMRRSSYHEAGHCVMALALGMECNGIVWVPNSNKLASMIPVEGFSDVDQAQMLSAGRIGEEWSRVDLTDSEPWRHDIEQLEKLGISFEQVETDVRNEVAKHLVALHHIARCCKQGIHIKNRYMKDNYTMNSSGVMHPNNLVEFVRPKRIKDYFSSQH